MRLETLTRVSKKEELKTQPVSWIRKRFQSVLKEAGVSLDGPNPWDPQIRNERALTRTLLGGTLGAGEGYVDGDWECERLDELTAHLLTFGIDERWDALSVISPGRILASVLNLQNRARARRNVQAHYDIGNELYTSMLGPTMAYSCGYWRRAKTLEEAQNGKYELVCRKLSLQAGQRVLEIGCGWGGFAKYAAERHGVNVVGVTISESQADYAKRQCAGFPVEIRLRDYRDIRGDFDRIVSIGMFEHVGPKNYRSFLQSVRVNLAPDGLFLLHTIGGLRPVRSMRNRWIARYIFPNAVLPAASQILRAAEGLFVLENWHNFGADYDKTLMAWYANFRAVCLAMQGRYGERFHRMWRYYLLTSAGSFRARRTQLWQMVFSKHGIPGGYVRTGV